MIITSKRVYKGNKPTNEILVSFKNGSDPKALKPTHTVAVMDALTEQEAVQVALADIGTELFLED